MRHLLRPTGRTRGGTPRRIGAALGAIVVVGAAAAFAGAPRSDDRLETITTALASSTTSADTLSAARTAPVGSPNPADTPPPTVVPTTLVPAAATGDPPPAEMAPRPTEAPPAPAARRTPAAVTSGGRAPAANAAAAGGAEAATPPSDTGAPQAATNCLLWLHGKGGHGAATTTNGGIVRVAPTGNAAGWGGRQWMYFPESGYQAALGIVTAAVDEAGCTRVIVGGFSNGGAFAAKLYCRGESFGGRLVRVVVDDPVVDNAVNGCSPASGVGVTLYWTGALEGTAQPGWACAGGDWTCEGGTTIGIDAYAAALGTPAKRSPMGGHSPYTGAPELSRF